MTFSVVCVAAEHFGQKRWWRPARTGAAWFYHTPAPSRPPSFMRDYHTVDPQIRRLVMLLHAKGMATLPSCSGHWPNKQWAKRCYDDLLGDVHKIRYIGEQMIDVETGERTIFKDMYWGLPWGSWDHFLAEAQEYNGQGYLCFHLPPTSVIWRYLDDMKALPGVHVRVVTVSGKLCLEVRVQTADANSQANAWHSVECFLRQLG